MSKSDDLVSEERSAFERLRTQFGDKFRFQIEDGHVSQADLSNCALTAVPPELGQLTELTELSLRDNQLTAVSPELGRLIKLTTLYLSSNQLTAVPPKLGQLAKLTALWMDDNQLVAVPPELGQLTKLTELWLQNNRLTAVPPELGLLTKLTTLNLNANRLAAVPPELGQLTKLARLGLANNQLVAVPLELGRLTELNILNLAVNWLTVVPSELYRLTKLTTLNLNVNRLTAVPPELGQFTKLNMLLLDGNPLPDPYPELNERGAEAVKAYLRSLLDKTQVVTLREARLILVGNGNVGKTQLKNALLGLPFEERAATTHGVAIDRDQKLTLHCDSSEDLTLTIWDFGGQETYEVTHQFFYGRRSIYLLVWHPRTPPDLGVEAWLRKLKLRLGDAARVIIVATHKNTDQRPADLDLVGLQQKFGDIILGAVYPVENKSRDEATNGIPELKKAIATAANKLSVMGMKVNKDWLAVREDITALSRTETHIPRPRFDEIASSRGLTPDVSAVWLNLLHDLGDLLYYSDVKGLKDTVVLRPDWLTGGIARVLDDAEVLTNRGVLNHDRLPQLWEKYAPALHPFLHAVMEQFDICCRDKGEDWSLVGEKVPHARPDGVPQLDGQRLHMVYELGEDPPGLVPWLIVRNYRFTAHKHWRLGAYLQHDGHGALIEFDRGTQRLTLTVHGPVPLNLFALLQDGVEQVLPRWEGLRDRVSRLIPCGQTRKDSRLCDRHFALPDLKAAAADGDPLQCNGCRKMADVSRLLSGIGIRQEPILEQMGALLDEKLEPLRQLFQHGQRTLLRALSNVSKDAPRLFSMWPKAAEDKSWWEWANPTQLGTHTYEVWLWCEHCEQPHPVKRYDVQVPAEWLVKIAPYAKMIATAIKVGLPAIGGGLGLYLDRLGASKEDKKDISDRIDKMSKLADKCLTGDLDLSHKREAVTDGFSAPEGAALREFHALLRDIDKSGHWGDLKPTATKEGDYLWLCPEHYKEFNPGLITIPTTAHTNSG